MLSLAARVSFLMGNSTFSISFGADGQRAHVGVGHVETRLSR